MFEADKGETVDTIFQLSNLLVLPFWFLMILLPNWSSTRRVLASPWVVAPAALLYALLVVPALPALLPALANPQLDAIAAALSTPLAATIAWVHFLAFDLFVGRWAYLDSRQHNISPWLVSPLLFLILMVGPFGLLLYLALRLLAVRRAEPAATLVP
jgi:hypothetical protein